MTALRVVGDGFLQRHGFGLLTGAARDPDLELGEHEVAVRSGETRVRQGRVRERFEAWMLQQQNQGNAFTDEQRQWLEAIRDHVTANAEVAIDDLGYAPFAQMGGVGKAVKVFGGDGLVRLLDELNEALAA